MKPRRAPPLNALRAFEAAARSLSFQKAATQLFVTPAAVSHQVKRLEAYLGTELFERGHRTVTLTREGATLAASLSEVFGMLHLALDLTASTCPGHLRVSTMESFAAKWLAPRLHRFHETHPDIHVRVLTTDQLADFGQEQVDVAIRYGLGRYPGVQVEKLMDAPVFPVCAPGTSRRDGKPIASPADLAHVAFVHDQSAEGRPGVPDWAAWLHAAALHGVPADAGPVFPSIYLAQEAAIHGHGVALGLAPLVEEDLQRGRLVRPFEANLPNAYAFWTIRPFGGHRQAATDAFCSWIHAEASTSPALGNAA
ncbi:transcriptional regulator GcvA [Stenotrophomonas rhizophila]|uniref:transcriptional regulator GcvA n=1 Tax=Stenotrophomonas rhizophila TaxID=216778 RepID=UPI001E31F75B|nr:transcriptional regulator GcvA [Stenotrophomonas rhizophila]MCC7635369.1 transcriptional regulator GcvA [Stenotrophomonas rhizophila]MCC7664402.1 transcriptional regulator GcvA [Stenotrophomonas rhizophila]